MRHQQTITVRNNGAETFKDRYDGEDFEIEPGQETEMLVECATLCLGFGEEDKSRCLRRLGWAFSHETMIEGNQRLDQFSFHMPGEPKKNRLAARSSSSAPGSDETAGGSKGSPAGVGDSVEYGEEIPPAPGSTRKLGPLEKLAQAQARAG